MLEGGGYALRPLLRTTEPAHALSDRVKGGCAARRISAPAPAGEAQRRGNEVRADALRLVWSHGLCLS